jgi:pimeloyl-ACP methyl ester carboxylesterase
VVVCLHGSASTPGMWRAFRAAARGRCDVVAPELFDGSMPGALDDIEGPFHLVGHGLGGGIALQYAARRPHRVLGLVLYEPAGVSADHIDLGDIPVHLVSGTRSWFAARRGAERMLGQIAHATLLRLVGLRHMAPLTHPRQVNDVILDYLLPVSMPGQPLAA